MKQSVLLGLRDKLEKGFQNMLDDMNDKYKNKQGLFLGLRKTYVPLEGYADEPTKRGFAKVASTVSEQIAWFKEHTADYFENVLTIERTNASGLYADLIVDGKSWGMYSTLELLRLKSILDSKMKHMISILPIRSESTSWKKTADPVYEGRDVYEDSINDGFEKTTIKRIIVVDDPHIKDAPGRAPVTQQIDTQVNIGKYSIQNFSGQITNLERAKLQVKYDTLYKAVIVALEEANAAESVKSDLGGKVLNYLF